MKITTPRSRTLAQPAASTTRRTSMNRHVSQFVRKAIAIGATVILATPFIGGPAIAAPVGYTTGTYSQNFSGFTTTGTAMSMTLQQMYEVNSLSGGGTVTGWYAYVNAGSTGNRWLGSDTGSSNSGGFRAMYSSSGGNLAIGSQGSGNAQGFYGVVLQNNSGSTINTVSLSWDAVINRNPSTTANPTALSWLVSGSNVNTASTGTTAGTFGNGAGSWTTPGGSFSYSTPASGTGAPGTQAAINPMFTFASPTGSLSSLSWGAGQYLYLRWSETDDGGADATFGIDNFNLWTAAASAQNLTWNVTNGTWNTSVANWTGGSSNVFAAGDTVTFSGTGGGTVTLSGSLGPASMTISATAGTYTFSGATAGDKISGATSIAKSGAGTAVFTSANDFSGGVSVTGGIVSISGSDQLGNGTITLNGGQLTSTAGSALTLANALTIGGSNGTVNTGAQNLTVNGGATLGGTLTKSGNGTLFLASPTVNAGAGFNVGAGAIQLGGAATSGVYSLATSSTLTGNLTIGGTQRLNVNAGGSITGSGTLQFMTSGALLSQQSGFTGGTVSAPIALNSTGAAFTPGVYTTGSYTPGSFVSTIGATSGVSGTAGTFTVNSVISGSADVNISNNSATGGGRGLLVLGGQSTYTGNTMIDANTPDGFSAVSANVQLGVSNALPTSTGLIYGTRSGAGAAVIDLNGFSQQVAFVGDGNQFVAGTKFLTITNLSSGTSTFTIGGSTNATFGGVLASGSAGGSLKLVKQGSGSQTLSGSSTFGGGTTLNAGTLVAGNAAAFGTGAVVVNGGTLDLGSYAIGNAVTVNGGSLANAGSYSGATTITGTVSLGNVPNSTVTVAAGGVLQGTPTVASLGGAGLVSPGNSPGIITAGTLDPSGGIDFALEFTGTAPDYGTAAASVNDVVRLTAGSPFLSSLTGDNVVDVYLNVNSFAVNDSFQGGFFTTLSANDLLTALSGATFNFFGKATGGSVAFNGESYNPLTSFAGITGATVSTTAVTANFGGGNVTGSAMQFVIVPEPTALALAGLGVALAGSAAWKRRRAA